MSTKNQHKTSAESSIQHIRKENLYLSRSILLEETGSGIIIKQISFFSILIIVVLAIWVSVMNLDEVAISNGELINHGKFNKIQHLIGGKILAIQTEEGMVVKKGDTLLQIDPENEATRLHELSLRKQVLSISKIRLEALLHNKSFRVRNIKEPMSPQVLYDQKLIFNENKQSNRASDQVIINQIEQVKSQIREASLETTNLQKRLQILKKEEVVRKDLMQKGLNSKIAYMDLQKEINDIEGKIYQMAPKKKNLNLRLAELRQTRIQSKSSMRNALLTELSEVNTELVNLENNILLFSNNVNYLTILSPIEGYIKNLSVKKVGEIIGPGQTLMEIIPKERDMEAEIKISSQDIGHVKLDQDVTLKLTTYNFRRYGGIHGKLKSISSASYLNPETGESYYLGIVSIDDNAIQKNNQDKMLLPGMTLSAEIKTGEKSLLDYLLKPIQVSATEAFRER